ncbi:hypothetical protein H6503_06320 [Candidatus Woesearchaeota archaeon]|nr:hypothetical protein [Candidatus Woesearchaeota archaeon]
MEHINKFYAHAHGKLDDFLKAMDYSTVSKAKDLLQELNSIPEQYHDAIKQTVVDRLKDFYQITMDHLKDYKLDDIKIIDGLAIQGNIGILKQQYGIERKADAKGHPKPYMLKEQPQYIGAGKQE